MRDTRRRRASKRGILEHQYAPVRFLRSDQRPGLEQYRSDIAVMPDCRNFARLRLVPLYAPQDLPEWGKILGSDTAVICFTLGTTLRLFSHVWGHLPGDLTGRLFASYLRHNSPLCQMGVPASDALACNGFTNYGWGN